MPAPLEELAPRLVGSRLLERPSSTRPLVLTFTRPLEAAAVSSYVALDPATPGDWLVEGRDVRFLPDHPLVAGKTYTVTVTAGWPGRNGLPLLWTSPISRERLHATTFCLMSSVMLLNT